MGGYPAVPLFTSSEFEAKFKHILSSDHVTILAHNGDGVANGIHVDGVTIQNGDAYVTTASNVSGLMRINYAVFIDRV